MDAPDDAELLRCYAEEHSEEAFVELVRRHLHLVYRAALRRTRGDSHRAEDVAQAVFAALAQRAGVLSRHPRLVGWLYTTTQYIASAQLRGEARRSRREGEAAMMAAESADAKVWEDAAPQLDEALQGLGQVDREAILLHFFEGKAFAEVGERLRMKEDAARMRVNRALEKLRMLMERRGVAASAAGLALVLNREAASALPAHLLTAAGRIAAAAGASVQAMPAATLLQIMSTSKLALGALAVLGLLVLGTGLHETQRVRADRAALATWNGRMAEAQQRLAATEKKEPITGPRRNGGAVTPRIAGGVPGASGADALPSDDEIARQLELLRLRNRQDIADNLLKHGDALRALGITNEQIAALETRADQAMSEIAAVQLEAKLAGVPISADPELMQKAQQIVDQYQADLTQLLGAEKLQALQDFQKSQMASAPSADPNQPNNIQLGEARYVATQVAGQVFASSAPLSDLQRAQLVRILAQNEPRYQPGDNNDMDTINWNGVIAQATAAALPPSQLEALKNLQRDTVLNQIEQQARTAAAGSK
ncbi:MAG TPA: sigma-70 family RNA polymerase sigma factor [Opitutaceae bacterium]|jgi:RNA polymerase sigma factor (sigma-70 family)|nr:sigma-70 family RNA polymerase sigma factor [Opitutaceae bacterium]